MSANSMDSHLVINQVISPCISTSSTTASNSTENTYFNSTSDSSNSSNQAANISSYSSFITLPAPVTNIGGSTYHFSDTRFRTMPSTSDSFQASISSYGSCTSLVENFISYSISSHTSISKPMSSLTSGCSMPIISKQSLLHDTIFPPIIDPPFKALSSPFPKGMANNSKVVKRRARTNHKAPPTPIRVLSVTDISNFRDMVQQFTGIPALPINPSHMLGSSSVPLLRPHSSRLFTGPPSFTNMAKAQSLMRPLKDLNFPQRCHHPSSASSSMASMSDSILTFPHGTNINNFHQGKIPQYLNDTTTDLKDSMLPAEYSKYKELNKTYRSQDGDQSLLSTRSPPGRRSFLTEDDMHATSPYNTLDSWIAPGGVLSSLACEVDLSRAKQTMITKEH